MTRKLSGSNRQGDRKTSSACSGAGRALVMLDLD
jgi:hypothetical protein